MDRYSRAKIYRLVGGGKTYYGSTCLSLSRRLSGHKKSYNQFLTGKRGNMTSFELLEEPDLNIVLVEEYPCNNKEQLLARERYWIENNECVNKKVPTRSKKEWEEDNKDNLKKYHRDYKRKHYQDKFKNKNNERSKSYRLNVKIDKIFGLYEQED